MSKDRVEGQSQKVVVFGPFEHNPGNKELTTGSSSGPGNRENKGVGERLKRSVVSSASSAPRRGVTSETGD